MAHYKRAVGYDVLAAYELKILVSNTRRAMEMGWQPLGGVAVTFDTDKTTPLYLQTMVLRSDLPANLASKLPKKVENQPKKET